jgi:membrane protein implicated in regulation of membrane protease activity
VSDLFASGHIVDLIMVLMVIEGGVLLAYHRTTGCGIAPSVVVPNLVAGGALLLALRGALVDASWVWIALCLAAGLVAHLADLQHRWRARRERPPAGLRDRQDRIQGIAAGHDLD